MDEWSGSSWEGSSVVVVVFLRLRILFERCRRVVGLVDGGRKAETRVNFVISEV